MLGLANWMLDLLLLASLVAVALLILIGAGDWDAPWAKRCARVLLVVGIVAAVLLAATVASGGGIWG